MTPEHKRAKQQIKRLVKRWDKLTPPGWDVIHVYLETEGEEKILAETKCQWEYHQATIRWYLATAAGQEDEWIEGTVVHEFVHILTAPMEAALPNSQAKVIEFAVESIARAIRRVT